MSLTPRIDKLKMEMITKTKTKRNLYSKEKIFTKTHTKRKSEPANIPIFSHYFPIAHKLR